MAAGDGVRAPPAAGAAARSRRGRLLRRGEHVLLADPATDTAAGHRAEVDAALGREPAHQRGDVAAAAVTTGGLPPGGLTRRGLRRHLGRRCGGGGGGRLGAAGAVVAAGLLGRGRGRLGLRRRLRLLLGGGLLLRGLLLRGLLGGGCGRGRGPAAGAGADDGQLRADVDGLVLVHGDLEQRAAHGCGDLGVDLVGRDLEQRLVGGHLVADGLEPAGDGALGDALAERRHRHRGALAATTAAGPAVGRCGRGLLLLLRCGLGAGGLGRGVLDLLVGRLRGRVGVLGGGRRSGLTSAVAAPVAVPADDGELGADVDGLVLGHQDPGQHAGGGRRDLGVDLVGRDLEEGLVDLDLLTLLLEPSGDRALGDALAQGGHGDGRRHRGRTPSVALAGGCAGQPWTCSGLPARARWASPSASLWVGWGWMRLATSSASASQL